VTEFLRPWPAGLSAVAVAALGLAWLSATSSSHRTVEAGFWFEDVSFQSARLGGALTRDELHHVHDVAAAELRQAFSGLRIRITPNRQARYHVRVVQRVRDERLRKPVNVAGQSRGLSGFGGSGVVNFELLASGAVVYAPPELDRAGVVEAIGRGVGRSAAHEFAHQFLPRAAIDRSRDRASYEFYAAGRPEHYFGTVRWDLAGPLLQARFAAP